MEALCKREARLVCYRGVTTTKCLLEGRLIPPDENSSHPEDPHSHTPPLEPVVKRHFLALKGYCTDHSEK